MKVIFDERCLLTRDLGSLLLMWKAIADRANYRGRDIEFYLDRLATSNGRFLERFNGLNREMQTFFKPVIFGHKYVIDWRTNSMAGEAIYRIATENDHLSNCGVGEAFEIRKQESATIIFGHTSCSYSGREIVDVEKISPLEPVQAIACGTTENDFFRIGRRIGAILPIYDQNMDRSPTDFETALRQCPERFEKTGRYVRHGRRSVYREFETGRLFYVDDGHPGPSAHLEVFCADGCHLGTASLDGLIDESTQVPGRTISW